MTDTEGDKTAYERIREKKTLKDILAVAASFEESARDFYRDLASKVGKNLRWLVEELADEEQRHADLFSKLAEQPDLEAQLKRKVEVPATDSRFSDCIHLPDLGEHPDDQAILQYALGREDIAMKHYRSLAQRTEPGPIRDLFLFLAQEETEHKRELEKVYYELIHSGGV